MPTTFYDREQAFEAKFAHDEEFRFLVLARRDKLFARWAAANLGLSGDKAAGLVQAVLAIPNGLGHDQAVLRHIADFLSTHASSQKENLQSVLERCMDEASRQLTATPPGGSEII